LCANSRGSIGPVERGRLFGDRRVLRPRDFRIKPPQAQFTLVIECAVQAQRRDARRHADRRHRVSGHRDPANVAYKAMQMGIPVWRFDGGA
jgi:hypothetical protein